MLKAKLACKRASALAVKTTRKSEDSENVRVFVGEESREFNFSKKELASTSPYFATRLDASGLNYLQRDAQLSTLWLEDLCPDMFELFAYWADQRHRSSSHTGEGSSSFFAGFELFIDEAQLQDCCEELHWDLVNLHLFAARLGIDALQDAAMDAIQDMYLCCDWDITPQLVSRAYNLDHEQDQDQDNDQEEEEEEQDDEAAMYSYRLRKWIVAMVAWTLNGSGGCATDAEQERVRSLFARAPALRQDYDAHMDKSSRSRVRLQFKNPQLRLPSNSLRNDERQFGFRQCSFHTHRSSVGQGRCPHSLAARKEAAAAAHRRVPSLSFLDSDVEEEELESDAELASSPLNNRRSIVGHLELPLGSITDKELVASPRTMIFDLYLDID
ncbi:hypothetical protein PFICI_01514 [Pestalotiopsis fici W106-1]|uniref:BTB domain-containing protein n=1 Tax=Pestalotiopsis fici (strain W106-1 / CGMCC3.15140) TaxID=1229662 RepID=W3XR32_PESFW|nr:uncharacterized protein PFICI_01514 [Pestalotiopsis fici W106-1]ETS87686.1 hypothetical protein PFICI_01514 [Pestalotiopsis fici W106-1]